ncbi:MAG: outer membrane protein assembly factor BamA [Candidatus Omnitrophica bacterium]|nr:outer membrane protein assembly factor BamA [Candidatus Omnitrophota bacterium]
MRLFWKLCVSAIVVSVAVSGGDVRAQSGERQIAAVEIKNNAVVGEKTIRSHLKSKPGAVYSQTTVSDDIKRLYATGYFRDVSVSSENIGKNRVRLIFQVVEKPILGALTFSGNRQFKVARLRKQMQIKVGDIFDQFKLNEDMETLRKLYVEKGYASASVTCRTEERDSKVAVAVVIDEGLRQRIRFIAFRGNVSIERARLLKVVQTKKKIFFQSGFLKKDVLDEDVERLVVFYRGEGFLDVRARTEVSELPGKRGRLTITFFIDEGNRYHVGEILVTGNKIFSVERIRSTIKLVSGKVFSEQKMREDINSLQSAYFDEGYISAQVKVDTALNAETNNVDVTYDLTEGGIGYVDKVRIKGNDRTKDAVLRREIRLTPGERYNGKKLRRSRERLYNLGYFEEVTFNTAKEPTTLPDKYDLDLFVKETKTGEFSFGIGYSSVDKLIGFVDLTQRNFDLFNPPTFTGGGQRLNIHMEAGSEKQDYELGLVEPWFLGYPLSLGSSVYNRTREWESYTERRVGGKVFFGKEIGEYWRNRVTFKQEGVRITDLSADVGSQIRAEEGKNILNTLEEQIIHDSRDNVYNPTTGWYNLVIVEYAGGFLDGDKEFIKYFTQNSRFIPLSEKAVLEFRGRAGLVEPYGDSERVPIYERFYVGGAYTIRGYKERDIGPKDEKGDPIGGRVLLVGNAEYSYLLGENLKWAFFYDIGNVWDSISALQDEGEKFKAGVGTGMRVKTPLGPIRLDYGYALNSRPGQSRSRFHFTMSHEL